MWLFLRPKFLFRPVFQNQVAFSWPLVLQKYFPPAKKLISTYLAASLKPLDNTFQSHIFNTFGFRWIIVKQAWEIIINRKLLFISLSVIISLDLNGDGTSQWIIHVMQGRTVTLLIDPCRVPQIFIKIFCRFLFFNLKIWKTWMT